VPASTYGLDAQMKTYEYFSLDKEKSEFRLLELLPLPNSSQKPLQCRLKRPSLENTWKYEAISYTWGDPTPSRYIQVDGMRLHLPVNSENALRWLASPHQTRIVYMDAVCINQADLAERCTLGLSKQLFISH
jgi:hypothetical protein